MEDYIRLLSQQQSLSGGTGLITMFIIWPCLKRTGDKQIQDFDWLKSILSAV